MTIHWCLIQIQTPYWRCTYYQHSGIGSCVISIPEPLQLMLSCHPTWPVLCKIHRSLLPPKSLFQTKTIIQTEHLLHRHCFNGIIWSQLALQNWMASFIKSLHYPEMVILGQLSQIFVMREKQIRPFSCLQWHSDSKSFSRWRQYNEQSRSYHALLRS